MHLRKKKTLVTNYTGNNVVTHSGYSKVIQGHSRKPESLQLESLKGGEKLFFLEKKEPTSCKNLEQIFLVDTKSMKERRKVSSKTWERRAKQQGKMTLTLTLTPLTTRKAMSLIPASIRNFLDNTTLGNKQKQAASKCKNHFRPTHNRGQPREISDSLRNMNSKRKQTNKNKTI